MTNPTGLENGQDNNNPLTRTSAKPRQPTTDVTRVMCGQDDGARPAQSMVYWWTYLERADKYSASVIGLRLHLPMQDAMLQLKHYILDNTTRGTKAILTLDVQSAFDTIAHLAILKQISKLDMGACTYNYVKGFLTHRRAVLAIFNETKANRAALASHRALSFHPRYST